MSHTQALLAVGRLILFVSDCERLWSSRFHKVSVPVVMSWTVQYNSMTGYCLIDQICGPYLQAYQAEKVVPELDDKGDTYTLDMDKDVFEYLRQKDVTEKEVLDRVSHLIRQQIENTYVNYVRILVDHARHTVVLIFVD